MRTSHTFSEFSEVFTSTIKLGVFEHPSEEPNVKHQTNQRQFQVTVHLQFTVQAHDLSVGWVLYLANDTSAFVGLTQPPRSSNPYRICVTQLSHNLSSCTSTCVCALKRQSTFSTLRLGSCNRRHSAIDCRKGDVLKDSFISLAPHHFRKLHGDGCGRQSHAEENGAVDS